MHIALTADPKLPVPPRLYGGIERIVDLLARGLTDRGHEVTLLAHPESDTAGTLRPYPGRRSQHPWDLLRNTLHVGRLAFNAPDLVHSFGRLAYLTPLLPLGIPKIMSYQREVTQSRVRWASFLARQNTLLFTGCSDYIADQIRPYAPARTVYNGVPLHAYDFQPNLPSDAPLMFLGRVEYMKGIDVAVETALRANRRLLIAGNIPDEPDKQDYFDTEVAPHIDGTQIEYVGVVDDEQKNDLLGRSAALLMPTRYPEAFGIVIAEALACGTPAIGFPNGAVPEIIDDGRTGYVRDGVDGFIEAVEKLDQIDRRDCRRHCKTHFSGGAIVDAYVELYEAHRAGQAVSLKEE